LKIPTNDWYQHKDWMKKQLIDEIGFRPGFIRIRDCKFPGDKWGADYPHQGHGDYWEEQFGDLDTDDEESWEEYPRGIGGQFYWLLRDGEYEFGWDRWADKRGRVHST
ncbi:MAG: hypothetical protein KDA84_08085, partial [Planctomycetaceae bacterium]|nr:hypothetical protein [Planctomycetaceae bacterium]